MIIDNLKSEIDRNLMQSKIGHENALQNNFNCSRRLFSDEEVNILGTLHNRFVLDAIAIISKDRSLQNKESIVSVFLDLYTPPRIAGISSLEWNKFLRTYLNETIEKIKQTNGRNFAMFCNNTPEAAYADSIFNIIYRTSNLSNFYRSIDEIEMQARRQLTNNSLEIVLGTISVAKASVYLWAPKSIGGLGTFDSITDLGFQITNGGNPQAIWTWDGAVKGDVAGSMGYFAGLGVASVMGAAPGGNAVILVGWAVSAAIASVSGGFGIF